VFIAKNSDATSWHELLHQFGPFCSEFRKATKRSQMHQNCTNAPKHEFLSNGVDRVRSLRKILTRLRGTNFCTISARFAPSFVTQPNGPQCTKIVRTHQNMSFCPMGWIGCVHCEKFRRDFVARTFAPVRPVLLRVS